MLSDWNINKTSVISCRSSSVKLDKEDRSYKESCRADLAKLKSESAVIKTGVEVFEGFSLEANESYFRRDDDVNAVRFTEGGVAVRDAELGEDGSKEVFGRGEVEH